MKPLIVLTFLALGIADMALTHVGLLNGATEMNPFMNLFSKNLVVMWTVKMLGLLIACGMMYKLLSLSESSKYHVAFYIYVLLLVALQGYVVIHNTYMVVKYVY